MESVRRGPGPRFWCIAAGVLLAVLLLVWTAAQVAGLLVHGSWPHVSLAWSIVELVQVLHGAAPADGVPIGLFWVLVLLEVAAGLAVAAMVVRRVGTNRGHVWVPRPPEGIAATEPFIRAYRRLAREDGRRAVVIGRTGPPAPPALAGGRALTVLGGGLGERLDRGADGGDVAAAARFLAGRFSRAQLQVLVGELAERRMARDVDEERR